MSYLGQRTFASFEKKASGWGSFFEEEEFSQNFGVDQTRLFGKDEEDEEKRVVDKNKDESSKYRKHLKDIQSKSIQNRIEDPEIEGLIFDNEASKNSISNYEEGKALTGYFAKDFDNAMIPIQFTVTRKVDKNDPNGIAYEEYLWQIYQMSYDRIEEKVLKRKQNGNPFWNHFPEVHTPSKSVTVHTNLKVYLQHLLGRDSDSLKNDFAAYYLINEAKNKYITVTNSKTINDNLFLLDQLGSTNKIIRDYEFHYEMQEFYNPEIENENQESSNDSDINIIKKDETNLKKNTIHQAAPTLKDKILYFVKSYNLADSLENNPELLNVVSQVLLSSIEDRELKKNTQTPAPELYKEHLDFQGKTIRESELYKEIDIARGVYSEYFQISQDIYKKSPKRHSIEKQQDEIWVAQDELPTNEMMDAQFIWSNVISNHVNNTDFLKLRNEYPSIPFGSTQYIKMYPSGAWSLSNREIVEMLRGGLPFDISVLSEEKNSEDEISLADQLGGMVTQLETISDTRSAIKDELIGKNYDGTDAIRLPSVLMPKFENEQIAVQLSLYLVKVGPLEWKIIDFSIPTGVTPTYTGKGNTAKEAIMNALVEFGQEATYPKGDIIAEGPKEYFGEDNRIKVHSTGENWDQEVAGDLSMISTISGVLGLALVFTPLSPLGAGLLFVSGITGAGAAGLRIKNRIEHETFELNAETMLDIIDIVTGVIVSAKVAKTALNLVDESGKASKMVVITEGIDTGADVASVVLIGNQFLGEIKRIEKDDSLSDEEKESQKAEILQKAAAAGFLMLIGYVAPKINKKFGRKHLNILDDADTIARRIKDSPKLENSGLKPEDIDHLLHLAKTRMQENARKIMAGMETLINKNTSFADLGKVMDDLANKGGHLGDGSKWVLRYLTSDGGISEFAGKNVVFELGQRVDGQGMRYIDIESNGILYEFKSVKTVPPGKFSIQFTKDLSNPKVNSLDQVKWYFDKDKNPANFKTKMEDAIDRLPDDKTMDNLAKKFLNPLADARDLKEVLKQQSDNIFILK